MRRVFICCVVCLGGTLPGYRHTRTCDLPNATEMACGFTGPAPCRGGHRFEADYGGISRDSAATAEIMRIGRRLTAEIDELPVRCRFRLLESGRPNAFSLSCGCIYLTRGLFERARSEELLAAGLAHELGHVVARDGKRPCSGDVCQLSREIQADGRAAVYLRQAGYRTHALIRLVELLRHEQPRGWADRRLVALQQMYGDAANAASALVGAHQSMELRQHSSAANRSEAKKSGLSGIKTDNTADRQAGQTEPARSAATGDSER